MTVRDALKNVDRLFLDTAPVIYFVEQNPGYAKLVNFVFNFIAQGEILGVTSPITLAESIIHPIRFGKQQLITDFIDLITHGQYTLFASIGQAEGELAAKLRADYNLSMTDALQAAVAIRADCDAFFTNDLGLRRIRKLNIIVLSELTV